MNRVVCAVALAMAVHAPAHAGQASIAVAANFAAPMQKIAERFEKESGHKLLLTPGATGRFYAQIRNGAPFDVLLAADDETPARLEKEGAAVPATRFTYAIGRLVLWSAKPNYVDARGEVLKTGQFTRLAIANPKLAPYGRAAMATMAHLRLQDALQPRLVQGESVGQAFQFVASGNAQLGFVALSQVVEDGRLKSGSAWIVPAQWHAPIRQDAVLLKNGSDNEAARALLRFLRSDAILQLIRQYGYEF